MESSGLNPISDNLRDIPTSIKKSTVSSLNPEYLANAEKDKGNECLRSKDYEEAIIYYTRSIDLLQRAALYTNRALAYLKMNNFEKAEYDTTYALVKCHDITPQLKIKALVRRATARMKRAKYQGALEDCDIGISLSGDSDKSTLKEFTDLKSEITKKMNNLDVPTPQEVPKKSLRFKIEEVDEIDEEIILPSKPVSSRPLIEEILVENSESVVEEIQAETVASAFSSKPLIEEIIVPESTVEEIQVETSESVEDNQVDEINEVPTIPSKTIKEIQIENELSLLSKIDFKNSNIVEMEEYTVETINPTTTYRPTDSIIDSDDESEQEEPDFFECNVEENEIEIDYFEDTLEIENELDVSEYKNQPGYYEYTMEIIEDDDFSIQDDDDLVSAFEKSFNYNSGFEIKVEKFLTSEPNVLVEVLGATENLDMIAAIIRIILHVFENDREMIFHVRHVMRGISKSNEELQRKIDSVANAEFNALVELSL